MIILSMLCSGNFVSSQSKSVLLKVMAFSTPASFALIWQSLKFAYKGSTQKTDSFFCTLLCHGGVNDKKRVNWNLCS